MTCLLREDKKEQQEPHEPLLVLEISASSEPGFRRSEEEFFLQFESPVIGGETIQRLNPPLSKLRATF